MNTEDLLYNYAKHYLQHNVKTALLYENWYDKVCAAKDTKYMQEYISFRNYVNDNNFSDNKIKQELKYLKGNRIASIYNKLFESMIEHLESNKGRISHKEKENYKLKLRVYHSLEYVNFQYIFALRKIEEEKYLEGGIK